MLPNQAQLLATVRTLLMLFAGGSAGVALFHALGITPDANTITIIAGIVAGLITYVWQLFTHTKAATVARAADIVAIPVVEQAKAGIANPQVVPTNPKQI